MPMIGPCLVVSQTGTSSITQSWQYSTPQALRWSSVSQVWRSPGESQPRGRWPVKRAILSRQASISSRSFAAALRVRWCMPWPTNSQPASSIASAACG